jgi:hypothetical protein
MTTPLRAVTVTLAAAVVLCAAGPVDRGKEHAKQDRPERTTHATKPASTTHLLHEARDAREALIARDVEAIVEGMRTAQGARKVASTEPPK